jgi:hypothetical protein
LLDFKSLNLAPNNLRFGVFALDLYIKLLIVEKRPSAIRRVARPGDEVTSWKSLLFL